VLRSVPISLALLISVSAPAQADWSPPQAVSDPGVTADPVAPRVAADPVGDAGVVWADASGAEREVAGSFRSAGGAFGSSQILGRSGLNAEPAISIGADGSAIVAWDHVNGHGYTGTDLYLAAGQSNMEGIGEVPGPVPPPGTAREYKPQTNSLVELQDPVGAAKVGSSLPSFAIERAALTGRSAVIVDKAVGGTAQAAAADQGSGNWDATGKRWGEAVAATDAAIAKLESIGEVPVFRGVLWCQGERDAAAIGEGKITKAVYRAALEAMIARFRAHYGPTMPFYIFRTGRLRSGDPPGFQQVRAAQEEVAEADPYTWIVFRGAVDFPAEGKMNPDPVKGELHYSQAGYNEMGEVGARGVVAAEEEQEGGWIEPEAGAGPSRVNLWRDPLSASGDGFARLGPATVVAASTAETLYGDGSTKVIAPTGGSNGAQTASPRPAVSPGLPYTFSVHLCGEAGKKLLLSMRWLGPDGSLISAAKREITLTGGWARFSLTGTAPPAAAGADPRVQTTAQTGGATFYLDGVQLEQAGEAGEFFPTPAELESGAAWWSGGADESASELGGATNAIEARTRIGASPFGPVRDLLGPLRDSRIGMPAVEMLAGGEAVAAFTHSGDSEPGGGSTRVGASALAATGGIATVANRAPGGPDRRRRLAEPFDRGGWRRRRGDRRRGHRPRRRDPSCRKRRAGTPLEEWRPIGDRRPAGRRRGRVSLRHRPLDRPPAQRKDRDRLWAERERWRRRHRVRGIHPQSRNGRRDPGPASDFRVDPERAGGRRT
jgi:hypothetical protein